ncbi:NAD+ synthase [Methanoplanus endosymbiosus]|uniref:NH(3)-dependent NAD(+) synthetase n=1 Tax=Methanoplanus endosymbiosus TaxID=33865 RepID=A0A9E7PK77_9EURY|nr:NAD+ synthase [Methanoplanus endosymbiosus]UUX91488.1 NAD+ synthase [Methanoplanus endosymbiosus]
MNEECISCECQKIENMIRHTIWSAGKSRIVIGISGGIDSAVAAGLSAKAIGGENVYGYMLPSDVTPKEDIEDGKALCEKFGINFSVVPITDIQKAFERLPGYEDTDYLRGNLMARIRMTTLYYFANRDNALVCGTSNRSEYLLGYSTKHGDDSADIQPLLHLLKKNVRAVAHEIGVTEEIIEKKPSAGLYKGQSDEEELGFSYDTIDKAIENLEENGWKAGNDEEEAILKMIVNSAHKRTGAPNLLNIGKIHPARQSQ